MKNRFRGRLKLRTPRPAVFAPLLPTMLTLGNAVCGLGSITYAAHAAPGADGNTALFYAGLLIFGGMVFDMLDGMAARWARQSSQFGAQLDSLCDVITFGVAPAFILLQISDAYHDRLLWVIAALFMVCVVLRLARFNVETPADDSHAWFSGLPSPAAAATVASFAIVAPNASSLMLPETARYWIPSEASVISVIRNALPLIALVLAGLMVSRIRYPHVINQMLRGRRTFHQLAQTVFVIAAVIALGELAAPLILCIFVAGSPLRALWHRFNAPASVLQATTPPTQTSETANPDRVAADSPAAAASSEPPTTEKPVGLRLRWPSKIVRRRPA